METIYDYNVTPKEIEELGFSIEKEVYLRIVDEDTANMNLANLFWYRRQKKKAELYVDKLPIQMQHDWWRITLHP